MESQFFLHCNCPICYLPYNTDECVPRFITCSQGHTICSKCISIQTNMQDTFQCPFDKQLIIMLDNNISRYPVNRALLSIIEEGHANCEVHVDKKLDLICRSCKQQICDRCERKGPHSGHNVSMIEETLEEAKEKMKSIKKLVDRVQKTVEGCQADITAREQALLQEIDVKFGECIAMLLKKREETQLIVKSCCQRFRELGEFDVVMKGDANLAKIASWSEGIKKHGDVVKGMTVQPIFYELLEEDLEMLSKNVEESIVKGQESVKSMIKDIEKITVRFSPQLWHTFNLLCEVDVPGEEFSERENNNESFKWRSDWEKMDLLSGLKKTEEAQFTEFLDKIIETYQFRLEAVQHLSQSASPSSSKMPPFYLCSFSCFLGSDESCSKLVRWYILDSTLQNSEKKVKLDDLRLNENLFNILAERVSVLPEQFRFEGLLLQKEEKELLTKKIKEYTNKSLLITRLTYLLDAYMKDKWIDACYAANQIMRIGEKPDPYIEKVLKDATRVNCLRLALITEKIIEAQEIEEAMQYISYLQGLVKAILDGDELHAAQIQLIISEAIERLPEDTPHLEELKERLNQFNTAEYALRELSKTLEDHSPKKMHVQIEELSDEEVYYWKEKGENSAYRMKQLTNDMLNSLEPYVDFHNCLNTFKQTVSHGERQNLGYVYNEKIGKP